MTRYHTFRLRELDFADGVVVAVASRLAWDATQSDPSGNTWFHWLFVAMFVAVTLAAWRVLAWVVAQAIAAVKSTIGRYNSPWEKD